MSNRSNAYPVTLACVVTAGVWLLARAAFLPPVSPAPRAWMPAVAPFAPEMPPGAARHVPMELLPPPVTALASQRQPRLLALNRGDGTLAVIDPSSLQVVGRVKTGQAPRGVAVSPDGAVAYVASRGDARAGSSLAVIDIGKARVHREVGLGMLRDPETVVAGGREVYFNAAGAGSVARYNPAQGKVDWLMGLGNTHAGLAYSPAVGRLYAAGDTLNAVSTWEDAPRVARLAVEGAPGSVRVSPDGREVWVGDRLKNRVTVFDTTSNQIKGRLPLPSIAGELSFTPDGKRLLAASATANQLMVVDVAGRRPIRRLRLGGRPTAVSVTPDGRTAFVATPAEDRVVRVDLERLTVTGSVHTGAGPADLAFTLSPTS